MIMGCCNSQVLQLPDNIFWHQHYPIVECLLYTESPDVLIWVQGRAISPHLRAMIRESFGNQKLWPGNTRVMIIFFSGRLPAKYAAHQARLEYEFEVYRDIVQADFIGMSKTRIVHPCGNTGLDDSASCIH